MKMTPMLLQEAPNHHNEATTAPFVHPSPNHFNFDLCNITFKTTLSNDTEEEEEEFSTTVSPSTFEDWSEEYPSDHFDDYGSDDDESNNDMKVNGTSLVMHVTPTAIKAPYWKRRLGWDKPNMKKVLTHKIKQVFRAPVRRHHTRTGRSYEIHGADALIAINDPTKQEKSVTDKDRKTRVSGNDLVLESGTKDFDALGSVHHDLVFV